MIIVEAGIDYIANNVVFICNDGKGNFVLQKRSQKCRDERGTWEFGGGKLEFGEELQEAVLREIKEEYGINGHIQEQLPSCSLLREHGGIKTHWVATPFFIKVDVTKVKIADQESTDEIGIFTVENLPKPLHSGTQKQIIIYKDYFDKYR